MNPKSFRRITIAHSVLAWFALSLGANAQTQAGARTGATGSEEAELQEIVVTATRREERMQDVPISITAFNREKMDAQGLRSIDDLARLSPGVTFSRNGTGSAVNYNDENSDINIRGIDSTAGASTTGIYLDDTPIQSRHLSFGTLNAFPALFDLERVEVLRGPQGTLFGAGSEGGTVRFITPQPGLNAYSGYVRSEIASTAHGAPSYELGAAAGGPIVDGTLGFRVSASFRRDGGWVDRVDPATLQTADSRSNWQQTTVVRGALKWAVTDNIAVTPSAYYQELTIHDTAAYWPSLSDPGDTRFLNGNVQSNRSKDPFRLFAVTVQWDLGPVLLNENTSYYSRNQSSASDYTQFDRIVYGLVDAAGLPLIAPGDAGTASFQDLQNNFFEELRLESAAAATSRLAWTAGLFYGRLRENTTETIHDPNLDAEASSFYGVPGIVCTPAAPCPGGEIYNQPTYRVNDRQVAGYGEANLKITDRWKVTGGLRVSRVSFDGRSIYWGPFVGPNQGPGNPIVGSGSSTETPITPKAVLSYQPDSDNLFYASAAKGYRVGGTNANVGSICAGNLASLGLTQVPGKFDSDSLWSYEVGGKNTFFGRRLQINSSLFTIDWTNIQQSVYLPGCGLQFVANLGKVRSRGGDIDVQFRPAEALLLDVSAAYVDAKYSRTVCAGTAACTGPNATVKPEVSDGDRLVGPPWTVQLAGEYTFAPLSDRRPYLRIDYQVTTAQTALLPGQNPNDAVSDPTIPGLPQTRNLFLRAGLRWSGIDLSLFAQNLTDAHPTLFRSRDTTFSGLYYERSVRPRTIGATVTCRF